MKTQLTFLKTALILVCLGMICTNSINAQKYTYKPLALEGAHWWVELWHASPPPWEPSDYYQYVIQGDSIFNDISYKKVYYRDLTDEPPYYIISEVLAALVRDDTINQEVLLINIDLPYLEPIDCYRDEEDILYKFDVSAGDTLNMCFLLWWYGSRVVESIEYEFKYGIERKILNIPTTLPFIEGIGSEFGVFEWGIYSKGKTKQDRGFGWSLIDYCLGTDEECGCQWVGLEEREELPQFRVYPNPIINNSITLIPQVPISQPVDVKLYNMSGREVYYQNFESLTEEFTIYLPGQLSTGTSPLLIWIGNHQQIFFTELLMR
jgi:hypothetical protein